MYYGMFSEQGNALIHGIVVTAKAAELEWEQVMDLLYDVSTLNGFEEAVDTAVREEVYATLFQ
jgi:hypothetical protein